MALVLSLRMALLEKNSESSNDLGKLSEGGYSAMLISSIDSIFYDKRSEK